MNTNLQEAILKTLDDRQAWEQRQRVWYQMRHHGLPRRNKPFKGAADLHFPLIDTVIEKLKPFYFSQVWNARRLARFTALDDRLAPAADAASEYLDWMLREETALETELLTVIDWMLLSGRGVLKVRWDAPAARIEFEALNPVFLVVPPAASTLEDADWVAHIKHLTPAQYERESCYSQAPGLLERIRGGSPAAGGEDPGKDLREGVAQSADPDTVVIWEIYEKTRQGWTVHTWAPAAGLALRKPFQTPCQWRGRPLLPFVGFGMEVKDKGWYSPRGVAERLAAFETSLCKTWNEKHDVMSFFNRPLFTTDSPISNTGNIRFDPGMILPPSVRPAPMPEPPVSFDTDMQMTRMVAEQAVLMPDFGVGASAADAANKTATEINYLRALSATGVDLKGRIFLRSMSEVYRLCWALALQFQRKELVYFAAASRKVLPAQALHDNYLIQPDAGGGEWNKAQRIQEAAARFQALRGHPNVDQEELVKDFIQAADGRLVRRLFVASGAQAQDEADAEAGEIVHMTHGWPARPRPGQDHALRIGVLVQYLQKQAATAAPFDAGALLARGLIQAHIAGHLRILQQDNPARAGQISSALSALQPAALPDPAPAGSAPPPPGAPGVLPAASSVPHPGAGALPASFPQHPA